VILFTAQSLTSDLPCASILEVCVFPYSKVCPDFVVTVGGVNYNNNDRYCLNGQRLIAISGVDGQSGSEYRTEINSISKIKYNGNYWTVKTKSGQTFENGNTQTSKIESVHLHQRWRLSVVRLGSIYRYCYS
jgi:hypothetical protein